MAKARSVTDILTDYRDGKLTREAMLHAMQQFPWKVVPVRKKLRDDAAWEHDVYPMPGTTQEVISAADRGLITRPDRDAILDVVRSTAGQPHRKG